MSTALQTTGKAQLPALVQEQGGEEQHQYLTFNLCAETFAIGILRIKEIIEYGSVTAVPMMPGYVRGVINLRGAVVPVIDLARRFGGQPCELTRRTCIVIIEVETGAEGEQQGGKQDVGVVVDSVNEVLDIPASEIEPPPAFGSKIRADFIRGMGKVNGRFVILLDVDRVLSLDDLALIGQAAGAGAEVQAA